ncbi:MAG: ParB/RepB/Spo0J family partition protein [Bacteroidales bacterium]|nr:ParB/RepB/Spo0J family partition protein [Bacteroidales bacterium]
MSKQKLPVLGKGLGSILKNLEDIDMKNNPNQKTSTVTAEIADIPLKDIEPNPEQPRKDFDEKSIEELAQSIKENGIISPITVNKRGDKYQIIAGERRYRAAKLLDLKSVPAYIRVVTPLQGMEMALIENIQRDDLNAIEIALSLQALLEQTHFSHEELGKKIGKSRASIANYVRLLKLPAEVQISLRNDEISMGHARSIISVNDEAKQIDIVRKIKEDGLSVRQVEAWVARMKGDENTEKKTLVKKSAKKPLPQAHNDLAKTLSDKLSLTVDIKRSQRGKGSITIPFANDKDFERIAELLKKL